ncbi:hypothetical protein [Streptomyces virginiae]|uniref:hypothetical protein n=1 Tax=Streptomyces virginiae TaxID=1961 RepID=UPI0036E238DD
MRLVTILLAYGTATRSTAPASATSPVITSAMADTMPGAALVHLDSCFHSDPGLAPSVPRLDGKPGRLVDFSDPRALDRARIEFALAEHATAPLVIVEGTFALAEA